MRWKYRNEYSLTLELRCDSAKKIQLIAVTFRSLLIIKVHAFFARIRVNCSQASALSIDVILYMSWPRAARSHL